MIQFSAPYELTEISIKYELYILQHHLPQVDNFHTPRSVIYQQMFYNFPTVSAKPSLQLVFVTHSLLNYSDPHYCVLASGLFGLNSALVASGLSAPVNVSVFLKLPLHRSSREHHYLDLLKCITFSGLQYGRTHILPRTSLWPRFHTQPLLKSRPDRSKLRS